MILAHAIRLVPTLAQEEYFRRACGASRFTYNWTLAEWKRRYEAGEKPSGRSLKKQFNSIRREQFPWTYEVHRDCTARPFDHVQRAFQNFFRGLKTGKKVGYPKFKKRGKSRDSFYIANDRIGFDGLRVRIPVLGLVKMREQLRFDGDVVGATVMRSADQWHIVVQVDVGEFTRPRTGDNAVGVDLGIKDSAVLSTGEVIDGPKALRKNIKQLQRLSRSHSRKQKGSNNRRKSAMKLARFHLRIANIRKDWQQKFTTYLCKNHAAVGIEDLCVSGMVRNRKLARSIADEGFGEIRRQLSYKALVFGTDIVIHDRWFPSSKTCSRCGHVKDVLPLSIRTYECAACGLVIDRDANAAINLEPTRGYRGSNACGDGSAGSIRRVKLPSLKQELDACL